MHFKPPMEVDGAKIDLIYLNIILYSLLGALDVYCNTNINFIYLY